MTFDPSETFETRSNEHQKFSDIHDVNPAFEAANNEHFELSGRDPVLGGKLRERAVWVDERKCIGCTYCSSVATNTFAMEQEQGRARAFRQDGRVEETVEGIVGEGCIDLTEKLEAALGSVEQRKPTSEAFLQKRVQKQTISAKIH